jgi:hypothetical protein
MAFIAPRVNRRERVRNPFWAGVGEALQDIPAMLQMMQFMKMEQAQEDRDQARFEREEQDRREAEITAGLADPLTDRDLEAYIRAVERLDLTPEERRQVDLDFPTEQQWDMGAADAIAARLGDNLPFVEPEFLSQLAAEAGRQGPTIGLSDVVYGAPVPGDLSPDPVTGAMPEDMALTGLGATTSALPEASIDPTAESDWEDILNAGGLKRLTEQTELDPSMGPVELGDSRLTIGDRLAQLQGATKRRMEFIPPLERAGIEASIRADEGRLAGYDLDRFLAQTAADQQGEERKLRMIMSDREHEAQMAQYAQATKFGMMEFDANQEERAERILLDRQRFETEMAQSIRQENREIRAHDLEVLLREEQTKVSALERQKAEREAAGVFEPKEMLLYDLEYKTAVRNLKLVEVQLKIASGELTPLQAEREQAEINLLDAQAEDLRRGSGFGALLGQGGATGGATGGVGPGKVTDWDRDETAIALPVERVGGDSDNMYAREGERPRSGTAHAARELGPLFADYKEEHGVDYLEDKIDPEVAQVLEEIKGRIGDWHAPMKVDPTKGRLLRELSRLSEMQSAREARQAPYREQVEDIYKWYGTTPQEVQRIIERLAVESGGTPFG